MTYFLYTLCLSLPCHIIPFFNTKIFHNAQSICYLTQQYHGVAEFQWKDGMFLASVFLQSP